MIALVKNAQEDNCLKSFNVGDIYRASGRSECLTAVTDEDVKVLTDTIYHLVSFICQVNV